MTPDYKNHDLLRQKYVEDGLSIKQISRLTASSKDSVRKGLAAAGIAIRQHGRHHGHPSQPQFGKRIKNGRETDFKAEQKVVGVIRELREQKMTLRKIGQALTKLGVQTKAEGKVGTPRWYDVFWPGPTRRWRRLRRCFRGLQRLPCRLPRHPSSKLQNE